MHVIVQIIDCIRNVPFVNQELNGKTCAAVVALKNKLTFSEGTVIFIKLVCQWFEMMNVENKFANIRFNEHARITWSKNCDIFESLKSATKVISTCRWVQAKGRQ